MILRRSCGMTCARGFEFVPPACSAEEDDEKQEKREDELTFGSHGVWAIADR
jgi:hypothetical protein